MFFQSSEKDGEGIKYKTIRNAFVELDDNDDIEETLQRNGWQYLQDGGKYYVIGDDAMKVANIFPGKVEVRRPMADGVLNKNEDKKLVVLAKMIESAIGTAPDDKSWCCMCVSSESVDGSQDSVFHRNRLEALVARLGWNVKIIEEGHAVVTSAKPVMKEEGGDVPYSGIGLSFGAGRANCVLSYRGLQVIGMSVARSGDWIDNQVSEQTGTPLSQVIAKKEKHLDFDNLDMDDDVVFALDAYYEQMIRYVFGHFAKKFAQEKSSFEAPMDIVVAGGTSMPKGFCGKLEKVVKGLDLPFNINEVRHAESPRNAVCEGLYIQAGLAKKKADKEAAAE
tara:strand:+ start:291385 stop:292392 length:1008 start_codon:yes stop_codon:yes gene_type:complete